MADVQPVVVPVRVDIAGAQSALSMLGNSVRQARDSGIAPGPAGSVAPASANPDFATVRSLMREMQDLGGVVNEVGRQLTRFGAQLDAHTPGAGRPPTPLTTSAGAGTGGVPPGSPPPPPPTDRDRDVPRYLRDLLYGAAGAVGLGLGIRAGFAEVSRMATRSRDFAERAMVAGSGMGGGPEAIDTLSKHVLSQPGFVDPNVTVGVAGRLGRLGMSAPGSMREAMLLANLSQVKFGSASPGEKLGSELYGSFRTENGAEAFATLIKMSERTGEKTVGGIEELVRLFDQLVRFQQAEGGTMSRPRGAADTVALLEFLRGLPGGVGQGQGGMDIAQSVSSSMGRGMGQMVAMRAFMQAHPDVDITTPEGLLAYQKWSESQKQESIPATIREWQALYKGNPAMGSLLMERAGAAPSAAVAEQLIRGTLPTSEVGKLLSPGATDKTMSDYTRSLGDAPGGISMLASSARAAGEALWTLASSASAAADRYIGGHPGTYSALQIGGGLLAASGGVAIARRAGSWAARMLGGAGATAGAAGLRAGLVGRLTGVGGGLSLIKDLYDLKTGDDPTNTEDLISGGIGAAIGGTVGFFSPVPGGAAVGALGGYGLGKGAWQGFKSLWSGPSDAIADTAASGLPRDGWRRGDIDEHLALLRIVASGGAIGARALLDAPTAFPPGSAGAGDILDRLIPMPAHRAPRNPAFERLLGGGGVQPPPSVHQIGKLRPDDPRIAAIAREYRLPFSLLLGLIEKESGFDPNAVSSTGAKGLGQLMPAAQAEMGVRDPFNPEQNLRGTAGYYRKQLDFFTGQGLFPDAARRHALIAYYAGRRAADQVGAPERYHYDDDVLSNQADWEKDWNAKLKQSIRSTRRTMAQIGLSVPDAHAEETQQGAERARIEREVLGPPMAAHGGHDPRDIRVILEVDPELQGLIAPRADQPGVRQRIPGG